MDFATPNLPARDFDATERFYAALGFTASWRDSGWMILKRGSAWLEFFPCPDLEPGNNSFGCCLRLDDLAGFVASCEAAGIPVSDTGFPRLVRPKREHSGLDIGYLLDPDGTLVRLVRNTA